MTDRTGGASTPRGRGRIPDPEKTAATRAAVVDAAFTTFVKKGFAATRMIDVARRAGVAKGTLYRYFETKTALFEAVLSEALGSPLGNISSLPPLQGSVRDMLLAIAVPALREMEGSGRMDILRLIMAEGPRFPEITAAYRKVVMEPGWAAIRALAARAHSNGELQTDALERLPILLISPVVATTLWNSLFPNEVKSIADIFEAYINEVFYTPGGKPA